MTIVPKLCEGHQLERDKKNADRLLTEIAKLEKDVGKLKCASWSTGKVGLEGLGRNIYTKVPMVQVATFIGF